MGGIREQREYLRNAESYAQTADLLEETLVRMETAHDLATISRAAMDVDERMIHEGTNWVGVMKFHDFELYA